MFGRLIIFGHRHNGHWIFANRQISLNTGMLDVHDLYVNM